MSRAGVPAGVMVAPMIPGLNDAEMERIMEAAARAGARHAGYVLLRLPHELRQMFEDWLQTHFPDRARHVLSLIRETRSGALSEPRFHHRMTGHGVDPTCCCAASPARRASGAWTRHAKASIARFLQSRRTRRRRTSVVPVLTRSSPPPYRRDDRDKPDHNGYCARPREPQERIGAMTDTNVIVGAGQAGGWAAIAMRQAGFTGRILLIGEEPWRPYERPPLSKAMLTGDAEPPVLFFHDQSRYAELNIDLLLGTAVDELDPAAHRIGLRDGRQLPYDKLLLATGGRARRLSIPGGDTIHLLRTLEDARSIRARLPRRNT